MPDEPQVTPESPPIADKADEALDPHDQQELEEKASLDSRGQKVVPVKAVHDERREKNTLRKERDTLKTQQAELQRELDQHKAFRQQVEPYLPHLAVIAQQVARGQTPSLTPQEPAVEPFVAELARELEVEPAVAQKLYKAMSKITKAEVQQAVAPLSRSVATVKAEEMRQRAHQVKDPSTGKPYASSQAIDTVFNAIARESPQLAESPEVANLLLVIARGLDPGTRGEPNLSEVPGGRPGRTDGLTDIDIRAAELRGTSLDRFKQLRNQDNLVLEDWK